MTIEINACLAPPVTPDVVRGLSITLEAPALIVCGQTMGGDDSRGGVTVGDRHSRFPFVKLRSTA